MGLFSSAKDRIVEQAALSYLNTTIAPYGRATNLRIDSTARSIHLEVELKGETAPVRIEISDYEFLSEGERYFVTAKGIQTSREWLTILARDRLINQRFELPQQAGRMLMRAL
ncbi:MAG: hypothetical protein QOD03_387 [Verrucomicrobiota bacterium]|jgi:hypothetical protein